MLELHADDKYQLLKAQMDADRKTLDAKKSQQELEKLILEMDYKYGLIGGGQTIDPRTATVQTSTMQTISNGKDSLNILERSGIDITSDNN